MTCLKSIYVRRSATAAMQGNRDVTVSFLFRTDGNRDHMCNPSTRSLPCSYLPPDSSLLQHPKFKTTALLGLFVHSIVVISTTHVLASMNCASVLPFFRNAAPRHLRLCRPGVCLIHQISPDFRMDPLGFFSSGKRNLPP